MKEQTKPAKLEVSLPALKRRSLLVPPKARRVPCQKILHGTTVEDPYAWLRAENWREVLKDPQTLPPDIRAYLEAENAYAKQTLWGTNSLMRTLKQEMRGRIREDDSSIPEPDGPYAYLTRYQEGAEHPLVVRQELTTGREQILLDADRLAKGKPFFDLGEASHSPDHRLLGWSADETGSEYYTIKIRDAETGLDLADHVNETTGELIWASDARSFYYVRLDAEHRPTRVYRHRLGTSVSNDELIYEEAEPGWFVDIDETQDSRFLIISISDHETSEARLVDLMQAEAKPFLVHPREVRLQYDIEHHDGTLVIVTNADGAEDFKIVTAPLSSPEKTSWRDLVPYRQGIMILSHAVLAGHFIRLEREDANPRIVIRDWKSGEEHSIAFDEESYGLGFSTGFAFETDTIRIHYSSMTTPRETYDYNVRTRERTLLKRQEIPSGHNPHDYVTKRIMAQAHDGERVPMSILHRRDLVLDGSAPCLLYGYGAYGSSMSASFRTNPLSLVDRGFVYAIAHIRGGTEKGWRWYENGKRERKPNTFKDFIACAQTLIAEGYTAEKRIVAMGGSAGGMLMGAVANMAPHLFAGIIADVPFVDVLNTMCDKDLPLTPPEWPEWGNPLEDEQAFRTILSYSPYDNINAQDYPAILAMGGLTDPRVTYWEPAKWVARLRETMTGGGPVLLITNMDAGHGGPAGRFEQLNETALQYAFAIKAVQGF